MAHIKLIGFPVLGCNIPLGPSTDVPLVISGFGVNAVLARTWGLGFDVFYMAQNNYRSKNRAKSSDISVIIPKKLYNIRQRRQ